MKTIRLSLVALFCVTAQAAQETPFISLSQRPLVMRLSKDEFRIAFGINGEQCSPNGCHGLIRYRVDWRTEGGVRRSEVKQVDFAVSPHSGRSITVDRQYFDTAEGAHTTEVVNVSVDDITCYAGTEARTQ
jgi:hypothetical protein